MMQNVSSFALKCTSCTGNMCSTTKRCLQRNVLFVATTAAVLVGITFGLTFRLLEPSPETIYLVGFPGEILMRMLKMMIIPIIVASMITGLSTIDNKSAGKLGLATFGFYLATTVLATTIGLSLVLAIRPGHLTYRESRNSSGTPTSLSRTVSPRDVVLDMIRNLFPENLMQGTFEKIGTFYVKSDDVINESAVNKTKLFAVEDEGNITLREQINTYPAFVRKLEYRPGTNTLGLLFFCAMFGLVLGQIGEEGKEMRTFFNTLNTIVLKLVRLIIWYSPIGILCLLTSRLLKIDDLGSVVHRLGAYLGTYIVALVIHTCLVLPAVYLVVTRRNPLRIAKGAKQALVTAAGTASSSATLPVTIRCCEEKLKLDKTVTRFVLPVGATINMDGTAIYLVISSIFIAQMNNIYVSFPEGIILCLCAVLGSIGAAGIPNAGIVVLLMTLSVMSLPSDDILIFLAIDDFLGRLRIIPNVYGDCIAAGIMTHFFSSGSRVTCEVKDEENDPLNGIETVS